MIFTQPFYFLILAASLIAFFAWPKKLRKPVLTISGAVFYAYFAGAFLVLLAIELILIYLLLFKKSRLGFTTALLISISSLVFFKYWGLLSTSLNDISEIVQSGFALPVGKLAVPLAISFFSFEFIHFVVDKKTGKIKNATFSDLAAFIFFFPTMIAGPIKRFQEFDNQIGKAKLLPGNLFIGLVMIAIGLFKKVVLADTLSSIAGSTLLTQASVKDASIPGLWISLLSYSFRIYFDFSGYSDIAIGSAKLFGINILPNFLSPYLKPNITLFWKSWHRTLYRWIVDYIYVPLGGGKKGLLTAARNTFIAFGISGIWHGASWHFLIWGLYHAALICAYRVFKLNQINIPKLKKAGFIISVVITFIFVSYGWLFFIAEPKVALSAGLKMIGF